jgi:hypothetical protein
LWRQRAALTRTEDRNDGEWQKLKVALHCKSKS